MTVQGKASPRSSRSSAGVQHMWQSGDCVTKTRQNPVMTDQREVSVDIAADDVLRLEALVGKERSEHVLDVVLKAGAMEAIGYATGRSVFSTMADLRSYRVLCLISAGLHLEEAEEVVAAMFKLTPSGSRRVVTSALARYRYELGASVSAEVERILDDAEWVNEDIDRWEVRLPPGFVRDRVLELCRAGDQPNPESKRGAVWHFPDETYAELRRRLGLGAKPVPGEAP